MLNEPILGDKGDEMAQNIRDDIEWMLKKHSDSILLWMKRSGVGSDIVSIIFNHCFQNFPPFRLEVL